MKIYNSEQIYSHLINPRLCISVYLQNILSAVCKNQMNKNRQAKQLQILLLMMTDVSKGSNRLNLILIRSNGAKILIVPAKV